MPTSSIRTAKMRKAIGAGVSIVTVLGIIMLLFVFSGQNADESSALSGRVTAFIIKILRLDETGLPLDRAEHYVRKLAHFTIYFVFVPGRGGTPQDVLLDYSGMVTGYFVCLGVIHIALKLCEKRNNRRRT